MPMETDPEKINDAERYVEQSIWKEGQDYAERNARSRDENKGRKESRERITEFGMDPNAFHTAVRLVKTKTSRELDEWVRDFKASLDVLRQRQQELFPVEVAAANKREETRLRKAAEAKTKAGVDPDTNPRSDPNAGGAKPMTGDKPWPDDVATGAVQNPPGEQEAGDAALNAALPETKGPKKSQSQLAKEALEAAKLGGTVN